MERSNAHSGGDYYHRLNRAGSQEAQGIAKYLEERMAYYEEF
ncbi:MAG: hypothetical protein WCY78_01760 [Sphaerochaetaceae bacterium]